MRSQMTCKGNRAHIGDTHDKHAKLCRCARPSVIADLIFNDCYAFAVTLGQNIVQQCRLPRSEEAGNNLHRSTYVYVL